MISQFLQRRVGFLFMSQEPSSPLPAPTEPEMQILAALFIDEIDLRQIEGPTTRIDLGGIQFSAAAPTEDEFLWAPHLVVIVRADAGHSGSAVLEAIFTVDGEQVARNVQPLQVDPGKFSYRLVRAEVEVIAPTTVVAHVRLDGGPATLVPFNHLLPVSDT
jgi:hypothetical protein